jgi:Flp pilus assembly protein TadG
MLRAASRDRFRHRAQASAMVELALLVPILGLLLAGIGAIAIVVQVQLGLISMVEEASRAAAHASNATEATARGQARGQQVAAGYALGNGSLVIELDTSAFGPGGAVRATGRYRLLPAQVPLLGLPQLSLQQRHTEPIPRYRGLATP